MGLFHCRQRKRLGIHTVCGAVGTKSMLLARAAREMGLRLVASRQQFNVYSPNWTEGIWAKPIHDVR